MKVARQFGRAAQAGDLDRLLQRELGRRQQHREFGPGQAATFLFAAQQVVIARQPLDHAVEPAGRFEDFDHAHEAGERPRALILHDRQGQRLQAVILQHQPRDIVGHRYEQRVAILERQTAFDHLAVERDLDVDLVVRAVDAGRIINEIGVDPPAGRGERDAAGLRHAEIGPLPDRGRAQLLGIDAQPVVDRIADIDVILARRLHIGADAAEPDQIDRRLEDRRDQRGGLELGCLDTQRGAHLLRQFDRLVGAGEHAAALGDQRGVVIGPAGARQIEQPLAFLPAGRRIGIGIEEDVAMVERRLDPQRFRQQHAVAEHVARHVAAADDVDRLRLHVDAAFGEVTLDRNPRALGGDAHRLVIVAVAAAAGEGVAEPEIALDRERIGDVGEGRGALVGGDHEIGILAVMDDDMIGVNHAPLDDIVGDRQQRTDEHAVAFGALGEPGVAIGGGRRQLLGVEAALGAGRHDHRVLHPLRLHQAQDFGAEIVAPVGPAQTTARDRPGAQVNPLHARAVDPDFAPRHRRRQAGNAMTVELERQRLGRGGHEGVGAQDCGDDIVIGTQDAVVVDRRHRVETVVDRLACLFDRRGGVGLGGIVRGVEPVDQRLGHLRCAPQRIDYGGEAVAHARLTQIAEPGAQQHHAARRQPDIDDQPVEGVVFSLIFEHRGNRALEHRLVAVAEAIVAGRNQEIVDKAVVVAGQFGRHFLDHAEAEILQHRHRIAERDRPAIAIDFQPWRALGAAIQADLAAVG